MAFSSFAGLKLFFILALLAISCTAQSPTTAPTASPTATPSPSGPAAAPTLFGTTTTPSPAPNSPSPAGLSPGDQAPADSSSNGFVSRPAMGGAALAAALAALIV